MCFLVPQLLGPPHQPMRGRYCTFTRYNNTNSCDYSYVNVMKKYTFLSLHMNLGKLNSKKKSMNNLYSQECNNTRTPILVQGLSKVHKSYVD